MGLISRVSSRTYRLDKKSIIIFIATYTMLRPAKILLRKVKKSNNVGRPKRNIETEKQAYYAQNNLDPDQPVIPELKTPTKRFQNQYTIPEFDPQIHKLVTDAEELSRYDKIESFRDTYSNNPFSESIGEQEMTSVNVHENLSKNPIWSLEKTLSFLEKYRARDILVIKTDANRNLSDHMIIATGITTKHLTIIGEKLYSEFISDFKKHYKNDSEENNGEFYNNITWQEASKHVQLEGNRGKSDWVCINILSTVIHLLSDYSRTNLCLEELHLLSHHDPYSQPMKDDREMQEEIDNKVFKLMSDTQHLNFQSTFDDLKDQYMMDSDQPLNNERELKSSYATSLDSRGNNQEDMDLIE